MIESPIPKVRQVVDDLNDHRLPASYNVYTRMTTSNRNSIALHSVGNSGGISNTNPTIPQRGFNGVRRLNQLRKNTHEGFIGDTTPAILRLAREPVQLIDRFCYLLFASLSFTVHDPKLLRIVVRYGGPTLYSFTELLIIPLSNKEDGHLPVTIT